MNLRSTLLLLSLCGLSMSEEVLSPGLLKLLPGIKARINNQVILPVTNVFVSGDVLNEDFNNIVTYKCTADGTSPIFKWFRDSTEITGDGQRFHVTQTETYGLLTISPLYPTDLPGATTYCEASNNISKAQSYMFGLQLSYCPNCVLISPDAPPYFVASGSDFSLSCSSPNFPATNYTWYLNGTLLETTGPVLTVKDIEQEGLGRNRSLYTCLAQNVTNGGRLSSNPVVFIIIDKISSVELTVPTEKLFAGSGSANLSCSENNGSMLTFTWRKDGSTLSSDGRVVISADMKSVLIQPLQKEDNGVYSCIVSNPLSTTYDMASLTVYYGPEPVVLTGLSKVMVKDLMILECSADSLPVANYTWKFNDIQTSQTGTVFNIPVVSYEDSGTYTCEASNLETGKSSSKSMSVQVVSGGLSGGAIAGIVIGVLAAVALAVGLFVFWQKKLRH